MQEDSINDIGDIPSLNPSEALSIRAIGMQDLLDALKKATVLQIGLI